MKLAETVTFGGASFERAAELRGDQARLDGLLAQGGDCVIALWRGKLLVQNESDDVSLVRLVGDHPIFEDAPQPPVFLGLEGEHPVFAREISNWAGPAGDLSDVGTFIDTSEQTHPALENGARFAELRRIMANLGARDAELAAMSVGVFSWHAFHTFCPNCGAPTEITQAGWQRACPACNRQHFPRTDPVVIMLVTRGNDLLIGRSHGWPEGMYSLLAGFMEPGETIEAAVRREVFEETQVRVGKVGYLASQPWPFPASLMIGCYAQATSRDITVDDKELDDACWISREKLADSWSANTPTLVAARKGAIAHFLIKNWLADTLD